MLSEVRLPAVHSIGGAFQFGAQIADRGFEAARHAVAERDHKAEQFKGDVTESAVAGAALFCVSLKFLCRADDIAAFLWSRWWAENLRLARANHGVAGAHMRFRGVTVNGTVGERQSVLSGRASNTVYRFIECDELDKPATRHYIKRRLVGVF